METTNQVMEPQNPTTNELPGAKFDETTKTWVGKDEARLDPSF